MLHRPCHANFQSNVLCHLYYYAKKSSPEFERTGERFEYRWYEHPGIGRVELKEKRINRA